MGTTYRGAMIKVEGPDLYELRQEFKKLPKNIAARVIGAALKRASAPAERALKSVTAKGPTGNLRRAIKTKVVKYPRDGAAVAVVGYVKAGTGKSKSAGGGTVKKGPDRAYHQFFVEFGTKERTINKPAAKPYQRSSAGENRKLRRALGAKQARELKSKTETVSQQGGYISSSFGRLGPFKLKRSKKGGGGRVATTPGYPKAFFIKSGQPIRIPAMLPRQPVATAYRMSKSAVAANLNAEMKKALENGMKILEDQTRRALELRDLEKLL
jgi:hypothetical protein